MTNRSNYPQDRLGNENREIDDVRGRDGDMATVDSGSTGTDVVVYELPDDVQEFHLEQIHYSNLTSGSASFEVRSATLNDDGSVDTSTTQTPTYNVSADADEHFEYIGDAFTEDALVVNSDANAQVRFGGYADAKEYHEPAVEQTET